MEKPRKSIFLYVRAIGMIISGLFFAFGSVSNFTPLPQVSWEVAVLFSSAFFLGFTVWHFVALQNEIKELKLKLSGITKPILRIKEYGNETKNLYSELWRNHLYEDQTESRSLTATYDTLFIDIFNKQKNGKAERVWSLIEWMNKNEKVILSHHGRWHIATQTMKNEKIRENLQYRDFDSNQSVERLYFAWSNKNGQDKSFYGLERDMDGNDSWVGSKYKLDGKQYLVKITLQGNNGVRQEFKYKVKNNNGEISITKALTHESEKDSS